MAVYVDDMRRFAVVNGMPRRWSHLVADDGAELRSFARRLGLSLSWIQEEGTEWEHFDVTDRMRLRAIELGAQEVRYVDLPELASPGREARPASAQ